jgi:glycosyltransferase involved in cell wall biosynthesis
MVEDLGGHALIIRDIPTTFQVQQEYPLEQEFNIALVNTFASDEPLDEVLLAAADLPDVHFYVTGRINAQRSEIVKRSTANVHFTDFLSEETYHSLLNSSQAVMCLTLRNHTMQRGACEALSLGKPIITSNWPILCQYFNKGTVHVDNTVEGIHQGVLQMKENLNSFQAGIQELQLDQQREWQERVNNLADLIQQHLS